jgi:hypothetical protein
MMLLLPLATQELATLLTKEKVRPYRGIAGHRIGTADAARLHDQFGWFQQIATSMLAFVLVLVMILAALRRAWGRHTQKRSRTWPGRSWP